MTGAATEHAAVSHNSLLLLEGKTAAVIVLNSSEGRHFKSKQGNVCQE